MLVIGQHIIQKEPKYSRTFVELRYIQDTGQLFLKAEISRKTRKSSCVNARGIPTAAYQVLHPLSCPGGVLTLAGGEVTYPGWGVGVYPPVQGR